MNIQKYTIFLFDKILQPQITYFILICSNFRMSQRRKKYFLSNRYPKNCKDHSWLS